MNLLDLKNRNCIIKSYKYTEELDILNSSMTMLIGTSGIVTDVDTYSYCLCINNQWWWHYKDLEFEKELINVTINSEKKFIFDEAILDI